MAHSLYKIASLAGFDVTVIDDRESYASRERFPEARDVYADDFDRVIGQLAPGENSYMVIVTRGHRDDMKILRWAVEQPTRYLGMIGSKRKVIAIYKELEKTGIERERLLRVAAPVGLAIGAITPQEIAVAIVAEMIAVRRHATPSVPHMRYYDEPAGIAP